MDSIILKKEMSCTATAFLESALGDCAEPERNARNSIFSAMITCGSSLLAALAKESELQRTYKTHVGDKQKTFTTSRKGIREWLSRWLGKFSFNTENFFLERAQDMVTSGTNVAIDASDISKEFGGEGMEGMERGHDGSRHVTAMGHAVIAASIVPKGRENAIPLVVKVHKGRKKVFEAEKNMIGRIVEKLGNAIQFVMDRGYDNAELVHFLSTNHHKAVIRAKDSVSRDIFADGLTIAKSLSKEKCRVATLKRAKGGTQNVELRYKVGYFPCETQTYNCDNAHVPVMVVSSRFDGKEIFLYVLRDSFESMTAADLNAIAENAAQAYFDRWSIETMFLRVKQDFRIEDARVRTFRRLENLVALAVLAHYFITHHLPMVEDVYSRMKKAIKDTFDKVISGTHAFLLNFRELLSYNKVSYIKGRPRKRHADMQGQMTFAF